MKLWVGLTCDSRLKNTCMVQTSRTKARFGTKWNSLRGVITSSPGPRDFLCGVCTDWRHYPVDPNRNHKDRKVIDPLFDVYRPCSTATPWVHRSAIHHHFACSTTNTAGLLNGNAVIHQCGHSHCDPCCQHEAVQLPQQQSLLVEAREATPVLRGPAPTANWAGSQPSAHHYLITETGWTQECQLQKGTKDPPCFHWET